MRMKYERPELLWLRTLPCQTTTELDGFSARASSSGGFGSNPRTTRRASRGGRDGPSISTLRGCTGGQARGWTRPWTSVWWTVLLALDRLTCGLTEDGAQLRGGLLPLGSGQALRANHEFAFGRDGDDHLC